MEAATLFDRLKAYGADMSGIADRFMNDAELYEKCFRDFLHEPNLDALDRAMASGDHHAAFEAAHALKGLTGNLGLTPYFDTLCVLVEALRAKDYRHIDQQYAALTEAMAQLRQALCDAPAPAVAPPDKPDMQPAPEPLPETQTADRRKKSQFVLVTGAALTLVVGLIIALFVSMVGQYENSVEIAGASHLTEICQQIQLYVQERIQDDWRALNSIAKSVCHSGSAHTSADVLSLVTEQQSIWPVDGVMLYTGNGFAIDASGTVVQSELGGTIVSRTEADGGYLDIADSSVMYALALETPVMVDDREIVAISVQHDLATFLDGMHFSSFEGAAYLYLTQPDGTIISRTTHKDVTDAVSITAVLEGKTLTLLDESRHITLPELLSCKEPVTLMVGDGSSGIYAVSVPVNSGTNVMRLYYMAPDSAVNRTLNGFSRHVTQLCLTVIAIFAVMAFVFFWAMYSARKKQFSDALLTRERTFDLLVKDSQTAFALFDVDQPKPLYVSQNTVRILGAPYISLLRNAGGYYMRCPDGVENEAVKLLNADMKGWDGRSVFKSSFIPVESSAGTSYFLLEFFPVDDSYQEYVGIAQDATNAHAREEAVRSALSMAERANTAKSRFLSNMSHDIRTPLNAILNMTDFALDSFSTPRKQREYLVSIRESSTHLLKLINDVLDMSRIESGQALIEAEPFSLPDELKRIAEIARPLCEQKQQTFLIDFDGLHVSGVLGDQLKVSQVLLNLLSNAAKFTPEKGAVRFTATQLPSLRPDIAEVRFMVEDTGIGIPADDLPTIFDPFARADDTRVTSIEGTGLGLSICKSYVAAMGGDIRCESEINSGSTFTVELFFQTADTVSEVKPHAVKWDDKPFLGKRCLLCEDNETNQIIAMTILQRIGFIVNLACNGKKGVEAFLRERPGYFDVIYMDIQMPVMDGYRAAIAIRESAHYQAKDIPIIAMTANVFAEDVEKARQAGMNGHIGKPIMTMDLIEETDRVLGHPQEQA